MPVARTYGPTRVATNPIPGVRNQASETNLSTGAALEQTKAAADEKVAGVAGNVSSEFSRIAAQEKQASDQTAVLAAEVQLGKWENARLYDPEHGALGVHGQDALPLPETVGAEFGQVADNIGESLSNDKQRAAYARIKADHALNLDGVLRRHVEGEITSYRQGVLQATVETATSNAVANANDPRRIGQELQKANDAIATLGPKVGMSAPQIEVATRKAATAIHTGVIERLLANDQDKAAQTYFEETKSAIDGDAIARIQKSLEEGATRGESQRQSDAIMQAGGSLSEQLAKVRAIDDPKLRDAVRERVEHEAAITEAADREKYQATTTQAFDILDKAHDVARIPPAMWTSFTGATRESLRSYAEHLAKGTPVETDLPTYYALIRQAGDNPQTFLGQNLLDYKGKLGETEFKQMADLQLSIKNGDRRAADATLGGFRTKQEIVDQTLAQYGIDTKDKTTAPAVAQLQRMLDVRVDAAQQGGKKVTNVEIQDALDNILSQKETVPGSWWAILRPFTYDLSDQQKRLIDIQPGDIPPSERTLIEDSLRRAGRPISDATVLDIYLEHKVRARAK